MSTGSDGLNFAIASNSSNWGYNYGNLGNTHNWTPQSSSWGSLQPSPHRRIFFHNNPSNTYTLVW